MREPMTLAQQARRESLGYGRGTGKDYRPWIETRDFPNSDGVRTDVLGRVTGRMHSTLSLIEKAGLLAAQQMPGLVDYREQFPLPLAETDRICDALGIKPPMDRRHPVRVTTDALMSFELDGRRWDHAIAYKPSGKLPSKRKLELLSIEFVYWTARETRWNLVTELELTKAFAANLNWCNRHLLVTDRRLSAENLDRIEALLLPGLRRGTGKPLKDVCLDVDRELGQEGGLAMAAMLHFIANRRWIVCLRDGIDPGKPLSVPVRLRAPGDA